MAGQGIAGIGIAVQMDTAGHDRRQQAETRRPQQLRQVQYAA